MNRRMNNLGIIAIVLLGFIAYRFLTSDEYLGLTMKREDINDEELGTPV